MFSQNAVYQFCEGQFGAFGATFSQLSISRLPFFIILSRDILVMTRPVAGYHMLMILSAVDGKFNGKEDKVIREFMEAVPHGSIDYDEELAVISTIEEVDYAVHFNNAMNQFYMQSTREDRNRFLDLSTRLVIADKEISPKENLFLKELFYAWEEETEE